MWGNGQKMVSDMGRASKYGKMGPSMRVIGKMIWLTERVG